MEINEITGIVLDTCIKIHSAIGPGCFERVYEEALNYDLSLHGFNVKRQLVFPMTYKEVMVKRAYKVDLIIEDKLVIEVKSVEHLLPVHFQQLRTYLKMMDLKNGLLLNFNVLWMKHGFHRIFNNSGKSTLNSF